MPASGNLDRWAEQGVLLLNAVLTVRAHQAASHAGRGWEQFTDAVVQAIARRKQGVVYMLWGSYAQRKAAVVDPQRNCVLKTVHPSPLSAHRGFFGCRHFSQANNYLQSKRTRGSIGSGRCRNAAGSVGALSPDSGRCRPFFAPVAVFRFRNDAFRNGLLSGFSFGPFVGNPS